MPKLRWECKHQGCFNIKKRPKIEVFDDCFLYGCAFGDVDGLVERNGNFLFLEWKPPGGAVSRGQQILHEQLTTLSPKITVLVVFGDPEAMTVNYIKSVHGGIMSEAKETDLEHVKTMIMDWFFACEADR